MALTTIQLLNYAGWMPGVLRDLGATWVKWLNPPPDAGLFAGLNSCIRIWTDDRDRRYIDAGEAGGRQFVRDMLPTWQQWPRATCYELANEPDCNTNDGLRNLRLYTIGAMREATAQGIKLCILNLAEGNPSGDEAAIRWKWQQLIEAIRLAGDLGHYVGMHMYWRPGIEGPLGRYHALGRRVWDVLQWTGMGLNVGKLQLLMTECGIDGGIAHGPANKGWRSLSNQERFTAEIVQLEQEARKHPWLHSLMYFIAGHPGWADFDMTEPLMRGLVALIPSAPGPTPPAPTPYYYSDRHGYRPEWIIVHDTEGPAEAALAWWRSPSNASKSSAHWLVKSDGQVVPVVPEEYSAHHAGGGSWQGIPTGSTGGTSNINHVSIGVELEYPAAPASPPWPAAQIDAAARLVWEIAKRYAIPRVRILRHYDVDPARRSDPRNLDWAMFLAKVMAEEDKVDESKIRNAAWRALGIAYNPDAAFPKYAREHGLGNPVTHEVDVNGYRLQGFSGGVVYARIGDWANCRHMAW